MTGEKKDRRSLFEISNSAFVESLSSNTSFLDAKHIPKKVCQLGDLLDFKYKEADSAADSALKF